MSYYLSAAQDKQNNVGLGNLPLSITIDKQVKMRRDKQNVLVPGNRYIIANSEFQNSESPNSIFSNLSVMKEPLSNQINAFKVNEELVELKKFRDEEPYRVKQQKRQRRNGWIIQDSRAVSGHKQQVAITDRTTKQNMIRNSVQESGNREFLVESSIDQQKSNINKYDNSSLTNDRNNIQNKISVRTMLSSRQNIQKLSGLTEKQFLIDSLINQALNSKVSLNQYVNSQLLVNQSNRSSNLSKNQEKYVNNWGYSNVMNSQQNQSSRLQNPNQFIREIESKQIIVNRSETYTKPNQISISIAKKPTVLTKQSSLLSNICHTLDQIIVIAKPLNYQINNQGNNRNFPFSNEDKQIIFKLQDFIDQAALLMDKIQPEQIISQKSNIQSQQRQCQQTDINDNEIKSQQLSRRKSISLFSRMMKPIQINKNDQDQSRKQKQFKEIRLQFSILCRKSYLLEHILQIICIGPLNQSHINSKQSHNELMRIQQLLVSLYHNKLNLAERSNLNIQNINNFNYNSCNFVKGVAYSCDNFHPSQNQLNDQQWNNKYITQRRLTSRVNKSRDISTENLKNSRDISAKNLNLNQINFSHQQLSHVKQYLLIYSFVIKEIVAKFQIILKEKTCLSELKDLKQLNKQTKITSFQSFQSKNKPLTSFTSIQLEMNLKNQQIKNSFSNKNNSSIFKQCFQLLKEKLIISYNNSKSSQFLKNKSQFANTSLTIEETQKFSKLLYQVWIDSTRQIINEKSANFGHNDDQRQLMALESNSLFSPVYELLNTEQQEVLFLLFVLKELHISSLTECCEMFSIDNDNDTQQRLRSKQNELQKSSKQKQNRSKFYPGDQNRKIDQKELNTIRNLQNDPVKTKRLVRQKNNYAIQSEKTLHKLKEHPLRSQKEQRNHLQQNQLKDEKKSNLESSRSSKQILSKLNQNKLKSIRSIQLNHNHKSTSRIPSISSNSVKTLNSQIHPTSQINSKNKMEKPNFNRSKNPNDHNQYLKVLHLQQKLIEQQVQLEQKQTLIKKILFTQEINQIEQSIEKNNLQIVTQNKLQNIRNQYKSKIKIKQVEVKKLKLNIKQKDEYVEKVEKQRKIQAKLLQETNQLYTLKKWTISKKDKQKMKNTYSSLSNLQKGCYKQFNPIRSKQNIQELSNIDLRDESILSIKLPQRKIVNQSHKMQSLGSKQQIQSRLNIIQKRLNLVKSNKSNFFA